MHGHSRFWFVPHFHRLLAQMLAWNRASLVVKLRAWIRETVRAVSALFYLANPPWAEGDGGETGLYDSVAAGARTEGVLVPPVNNSLVLFECTPYSWHAYARASRHQRNSLVMWLHRPRQDVVERWGESSVVHW